MISARKPSTQCSTRLRMTTPCIVLDVPHQWSGWTRRALVNADDIVIVAEPDLANLRNHQDMLTVLKAARPNDRPPLYCINQVGMHKRAEIDVKSFAKTMESQPLAVIPFDSKLFSTAANNGQMIAEVSKSHRTNRAVPEHGEPPCRPRRGEEEAEAFAARTALEEAEGQIGRPSARIARRRKRHSVFARSGYRFASRERVKPRI